MRAERARPELLRRGAGHAWAITAAYGIAGILWLTGGRLLGSRGAEVPLDLAWLFCLVSGILVFPCALTFSAIGAFAIPSAFEPRRPLAGGAVGAGPEYAPVVPAGASYLPVLHK